MRPAEGPGPPQASCTVDLDAIRENVAALRSRAGAAEVMAVVKADGYGHGLVPAAGAALDGGARSLGVSVLAEAFALRAAGVTVPVFAWLAAPGADFRRAIAENVDVAAYSVDQLAEISAAAAASGAPAAVHLKVDTGMWRGGATRDGWPGLVAAAHRAERDGLVEVAGVWSHLACADEPGHPGTARQLAAFAEAVEVARRAGLRPRQCHIANSAATLTLPESRFDLVRPGLAIYGLNPLDPDHDVPGLRLRPAMTLAARVAQTKRAPAGVGVSYGHRYTTTRPTTLAVVPLGYADGVPRAASERGRVLLSGRTYPVAGRVCMDQFMIDVNDAAVARGDAVVLYGPGDRGEPTALDWAHAAGTIAYEIVTRVGPRVPRIYLGERTRG
ncbi:alanine racemase [Pseudonocardia asaccharolytica]|uniref:Alanine racemase n=1 Tax=Pseudonocardia asaccharolytica DSM 44247 = NBRC 16224 TaxID=1123024 RepID=A0A511D4M8_9PSEU|nr:alanine racemase [Pseudonocardia asaccharolytica]GEL19749.1 alanine racemase [Pseudonocardia asaccharolytica DSM 44247 = NBRC 16224]